MDNNSPHRRRRVSKKVLRQRQLGGLAVVAFVVLMFFVLIARGCSKDDGKKVDKDQPVVTTVAPAPVTEPPAPPTEPPTTINPLAAQVQLSKREMFLDINETDISIISAYPEGCGEENEVWKSMNDSIAVVDGWGHVTGVSEGETYVILSFDNNDVEIEIKVHVSDSSGAPSVGSSTSNSSTETTAAPAV